MNMYATKIFANQKMDKRVYALRQRVMAHVYEARKLVDLPRITIRITEKSEYALGAARLGQNIVWISETCIDSYDLRATVYHEILHAVFSQLHVDGCPLMDPERSSLNDTLTKPQADKLFKKYANMRKS